VSRLEADVDNYLGSVTKPAFSKQVQRPRGEQSARMIDHLKKGDMARETERCSWHGMAARAAPSREGDTAGQERRRE